MKQKFLVRCLFLVLLLSAAESWALPECKKGFWGGGIKYHNCQGTKAYAWGGEYVGEWKDEKYHGQGTYTYSDGGTYVGGWKDGKNHGQGTETYTDGSKYVGEWKDGYRHGQGIYTYADGRVEEAVWENDEFQYAQKISPQKAPATVDNSQAIAAAQYAQKISPQKAPVTVDNSQAIAAVESERRKREALERELAALKGKQQKQQQRIGSDTEAPELNIVSAKATGKRGVIRGIATDNTGVAEVTVDGQAVAVDQAGQFEHTTFIPPSGIEVTVQVMDLAGLQSSATVKLERDASSGPAALSFDRLNPLKGKVQKNRNALALIVGIAKYGKTTADAVYADKDALMFRDYATLKLGVPEGRIKVLVNDAATEADVLLGVKDWLGRSSKPNQSDVYVFFAGHGLASADGEQMYLLPYDGRPRLLDKTAILRDELFADIEAVNPRSVTVFLDTCYSGTTRGVEMLVASRPIGLRVLEQSIPAGFTVFSAAAGNETSKPLTEAEHGLFSYFVMKGMEGEADGNADHQITAHELQAYVRQHVVQQSSGTQTPELQGDKERVLVRFQ